jgi:sporulation protein YlmC with PRC-barrel domain
MKTKLNLLVGALVAVCLSHQGGAQPVAPVDHPAAGPDSKISSLMDIEVRNYQDERLGRVKDLGIDLVNGRIVEVLVASGGFIGFEEKTVAVPPLAFLNDQAAGVYRLNMSAEEFKTAPAIDLSKWNDITHGKRIAAAYRFFGQEPYFLEEGAPPSKTPGGHPKVQIGYVERSSKMLDLPVGNLKNQKFGHVWSLTLDVTRGRILNVVVLAEDSLVSRSIVPAMALSFNDTRDGLLLDDTKMQYADEPRYFLTDGTFGGKDHSNAEPYQGPHTTVALVQGSSNRDVDRTGRIVAGIRAEKINDRNVEVGTNNGRVTLRGWVDSDADKRRIGEIAIAEARLELVDNQIAVGKPIASN